MFREAKSAEQYNILIFRFPEPRKNKPFPYSKTVTHANMAEWEEEKKAPGLIGNAFVFI